MTGINEYRPRFSGLGQTEEPWYKKLWTEHRTAVLIGAAVVLGGWYFAAREMKKKEAMGFLEDECPCGR